MNQFLSRVVFLQNWFKRMKAWFDGRIILMDLLWTKLEGQITKRKQKPPDKPEFVKSFTSIGAMNLQS